MIKKLLIFTLLLFSFTGFLFAQDADSSFDGEFDDFDSIFEQAAEDIEVEQTTPVVSTPASGPVSAIRFSGHFEGGVGLACVIIDKPDFGGYLDLDNILYINVKPNPIFALHGAVETSFENKFALALNYFYFDYMLLDRVFISAGKKSLTWGYTRLFENCNVMEDTNGQLNGEFRFPWSTGTLTFVGCYNYALFNTTPSYRNISYAVSLEQTIGHTSINLFAKKYGQSEMYGTVHKGPLVGLEAKRTILGFDVYAQGFTRLSDYKKLNSTQGYRDVTATAGFYRLWDAQDPNFGINIEYQYIWVPGANPGTGGIIHNHEIFLQGGIKRMGKNKNMKIGVEWQHNFSVNKGEFTFAFITDGLLPYASWENGFEIDYTASSKPKFILGSKISIKLDY